VVYLRGRGRGAVKYGILSANFYSGERRHVPVLSCETCTTRTARLYDVIRSVSSEFSSVKRRCCIEMAKQKYSMMANSLAFYLSVTNATRFRRSHLDQGLKYTWSVSTCRSIRTVKDRNIGLVTMECGEKRRDQRLTTCDL